MGPLAMPQPGLVFGTTGGSHTHGGSPLDDEEPPLVDEALDDDDEPSPEELVLDELLALPDEELVCAGGSSPLHEARVTKGTSERPKTKKERRIRNFSR